MNRPIIVFDFDKTLTGRDTILGFYKYVTENSRKYKIKLPLFYLLAGLTKLKLISNSQLKIWGVQLFLKDINRNKIDHKGKKYAGKIKLNRIYYNDFLKYPIENIIVLSASFEEYLSPLFPDCLVAGSKLSYDETGRVNGLERNLYGQQKKHWLLDQGVKKVDVLYTDSYSDKPLMDISKCVYLVKDNQKKMIKGKNNHFTVNMSKNHG